MLIFVAVIKDTKRIILPKTATKHPLDPKVMSIYLVQKPFSVHELPPYVLIKRFLTTMLNSMVSQMILTFINKFQMLIVSNSQK